MADRVSKSLKNAKVNFIFYFLGLFFAFFSRRIFLECLGEEFVGLTLTLGSILGYLNLAELGISSSISYFLYKPLQGNDRREVADVLSLLGYLYRWIGLFILVAAVVISLFFPLIFGGKGLSMGIIYFAFASILGSQLIGYFINYREILLAADQKQYLVSVYYQSAGLVKTALQIALAYTWGNPYVWVAIEFVFGVIACAVLNWKINREYPWLHTDKSRGRELLRRYPEVMRKTRQVFVHRIKDFVLTKSDELFVFLFVSLKMVAYYGNYTMIATKISQLFTTVLNSVNAGVGNLVAEGNEELEQRVFWELTALRQAVAAIISYGLLMLLPSFIAIWVGEKYVLSPWVLILLVAYTFMNLTRAVVDIFNHAHGLYDDVWSCYVELGLNVAVTFTLGPLFGIAGILAGKLVSVGLIIMVWKPYYLYHRGFHIGVRQYWSGTLRYYAILLASAALAAATTMLIPLPEAANFVLWLLRAVVVMAIYLAFYLPMLWWFGRGARDCAHRLTTLLPHGLRPRH
ncbi:MAG: sugar transporter [Bacteroidaceae bacterium]|nr:sugar transporter [Bacteroidaceae bacterium]